MTCLLGNPRIPLEVPMRSRRGLIWVVLLASAMLTGLIGSGPAGAVSIPDPCKVLKVQEISEIFGTVPAAGARGAREISSASCSYSVPASPGRPAGELIVTITFSGAKSTYNGLPRDQRYAPFTQSGVKGLYAPNPLSVVQVLRGSKMLSLQGVFIDTAVRPVVAVEVKDPLIALARIGAKRI